MFHLSLSQLPFRVIVTAVMLAKLGACATVPVSAAPTDIAGLPRQARIALLNECSPRVPPVVLLQERAWEPVPSRRDEHEAFWRSLGAEMPRSATQVRIFNEGGHHMRYHWSLVASRLDDGGWRADQIGRQVDGLLRATDPSPTSKSWVLTPEQGRRLDGLLVGRCLWAEPQTAYPLDPPGVGATFWTMDIVTPTLQRTSRSVARGSGQTGLVAQTIWENEGS